MFASAELSWHRGLEDDECWEEAWGIHFGVGSTGTCVLGAGKSDNVQIYATDLDGADPSSSIGAALSLPVVRGKASSCLKLNQKQLLPCTQWSTGLAGSSAR